MAVMAKDLAGLPFSVSGSAIQQSQGRRVFGEG
jgi:hypothetical protein